MEMTEVFKPISGITGIRIEEDGVHFEYTPIYPLKTLTVELIEEPPEPTKEEKLAANEKVYQAARDAISEWPQWKKDYAGIE